MSGFQKFKKDLPNQKFWIWPDRNKNLILKLGFGRIRSKSYFEIRIRPDSNPSPNLGLGRSLLQTNLSYSYLTLPNDFM